MKCFLCPKYYMFLFINLHATGWICGRLTNRSMDFNIAVCLPVHPKSVEAKCVCTFLSDRPYPHFSSGLGVCVCVFLPLMSNYFQRNRQQQLQPFPGSGLSQGSMCGSYDFLFSTFPDKQRKIQGQEKLGKIGWRSKSLNDFKIIFLNFFKKLISVSVLLFTVHKGGY